MSGPDDVGNRQALIEHLKAEIEALQASEKEAKMREREAKVREREAKVREREAKDREEEAKVSENEAKMREREAKEALNASLARAALPERDPTLWRYVNAAGAVASTCVYAMLHKRILLQKATNLAFSGRAGAHFGTLFFTMGLALPPPLRVAPAAPCEDVDED
eukprot:tig00000042_g15400.t3